MQVKDSIIAKRIQIFTAGKHKQVSNPIRTRLSINDYRVFKVTEIEF